MLRKSYFYSNREYTLRGLHGNCHTLACSDLHHQNDPGSKLAYMCSLSNNPPPPPNLSSLVLLSNRPETAIWGGGGHPSCLGSSGFVASPNHLLCHQCSLGSSKRGAWLPLSCYYLHSLISKRDHSFLRMN